MLSAAFSASAQVFDFADDAIRRGYYDRPWQRYEAEPGFCATSGEFLLPPQPFSQKPIQAEASNLTATALREAGDYVAWTVDRPGRGLTLRFCIPDGADGKGTKAVLALEVDGHHVTDIALDSYWAWQYTAIENIPEKYPDNEATADKFARMRFDEVYVLLDEDIPSGGEMRLVCAGDCVGDLVVDFVELEPVGAALTFDELEVADKVLYDSSTDLSLFIASNPGKTIFLPAGRYSTARPINIKADNTRIIGAGMWHTTVYFSASSDDRSTYAARGFHTSSSGVELRGMSINTANNTRYYRNNPSFQVGKGLNGSWGEASRVTDVRIDHFECGAWITGARNLTVEHCRFRNNYADGINLANNSTGCVVSHCSFRNNGDDDMASWSTGAYATANEYAYNTAENNWRASSLGFFGGKNGRAHHLAIYDAMEAGVRLTCDFDGTGFAADGRFELSDITIRRCGTKSGMPGEHGGFWGGSDASLELRAGWAYDLRNIDIRRIDIYDSRFDAVSIEAGSGKRVENLELHDININGVADFRYGVNIAASVRGNGHYSGIRGSGVTEPLMARIPDGFDFTSEPGSGLGNVADDGREDVGCPFRFFDLSGREVNASDIEAGIYIRRASSGRSDKIRIAAGL